MEGYISTTSAENEFFFLPILGWNVRENIFRLKRMAYLLASALGVWMFIKYFWRQPAGIEAKYHAYNLLNKCF